MRLSSLSSKLSKSSPESIAELTDSISSRGCRGTRQIRNRGSVKAEFKGILLFVSSPKHSNCCRPPQPLPAVNRNVAIRSSFHLGASALQLSNRTRRDSLSRRDGGQGPAGHHQRGQHKRLVVFTWKSAVRNATRALGGAQGGARHNLAISARTTCTADEHTK